MSRQKWRPVLLRIIPVVALIQLTLLQFRFFIFDNGCITSPHVAPVISVEDATDDVNESIKSTILEHEIQLEDHKNVHHTKADGRFMGHPISYRSPSELQSFHSTAHCIGDNFDEKESWKSKTCEFQNLCFDTTSHEFVVFASQEELQLQGSLSNPNLTYFSVSSNTLNNNVSIGGLNQKWARDIPKMKWFPTLLSVNKILGSNNEQEGGIYVLPNEVVMVPYHSMAGMNVGHLIWDDWLPLYTILETFDYLDREPLFIHHINEFKQWASCDYWKNVKSCAYLMSKFLPLMGVGDTNSTNKLWTNHDFNFSVGDLGANSWSNESLTNENLNVSAMNLDANSGPVKSRYVCGKNGLAGLGMSTDHGKNLHGWRPKDYQTSQNINRAGSLYRFRNYMMNNIGVSTAPLHVNKNGKFKIVFSEGSSSKWPRRMSFSRHADLAHMALHKKYDMDIVLTKLPTLGLKEQIELMSTTSVFVTVCGGGAVSAAFLPKGASLFVIFNDEEGDGDTPARLDWDMFNHLGYIRTHWLPRVKKTISKTFRASSSDPKPIDYDAFVKLLDHELDIISHL